MDYNYKNSLFHRISEFHYFSELLDNKVDIMLEHPWTELQVLIKEKWLTQKAFASILWKKVSEVNELLKWKRNITIQRDYLLHQTIWTPVKYRILKQVDYDYSLLDIKENSNSPLLIGEGQGEVSQHQDVILSVSEESFSPLDKEGLGEIWSHSEALPEKSKEAWDQVDSSSLHPSEWQTITQETPVQEPEVKDNKDLQNRAKIFRSF